MLKLYRNFRLTSELTTSENCHSNYLKNKKSNTNKGQWNFISILNITKLESLFVRLNALIFGTTSPIWKIHFTIDSWILEKGFRLYNMTLRLIKLRQAKNRKIHVFSITGKPLIGSRRGFLKIIGLNELRIHLSDTTHVAITISEISDFNLRQLGLL